MAAISRPSGDHTRVRKNSPVVILINVLVIGENNQIPFNTNNKLRFVPCKVIRTDYDVFSVALSGAVAYDVDHDMPALTKESAT